MSETIYHEHDVHLTTPELITAHGYIPETHHIWTEDGYCLEIHRIVSPDKLNSSSVDCDDRDNFTNSDTISGTPEANAFLNKTLYPPVIINHGLLSSSADWVLLGPQKALAYILSDNGFDVWLANVRGNTYSKRHKEYTVKDKEFWNFSWHEIGCYDLPAMIDYILQHTGHKDLYYIGYSQGTSAFYVMGSERSEYNSKIRVMISLAPIAFLSNQRSPLLKLIVHFNSIMEWGSTYWNIHQWFPRNTLQARALGSFIRNAPGAITKSFCNCWFHLIAGFGSNQLDKSMLPLIFKHFPAGASAKQIIHYSQTILSGSFRKFDYGAMKNLKIYGSTQPPKYNLEKIEVPVFIFYSENDFLTNVLDVQKLARRLPKIEAIKKIEYSKFNHIDYLWGRDANILLYNQIVKILKRM